MELSGKSNFCKPLKMYVHHIGTRVATDTKWKLQISPSYLLLSHFDLFLDQTSNQIKSIFIQFPIQIDVVSIIYS